MKIEIENLLSYAISLNEYERKQIIAVLIASMLNDSANDEAKNKYDNIINTLEENI